jgi:hypothetical protein
LETGLSGWDLEGSLAPFRGGLDVWDFSSGLLASFAFSEEVFLDEEERSPAGECSGIDPFGF